MTEPAPDSWRRTVRPRLALVLACVGVWAVAIEARLVYLQVYAHDYYVARAERQHNRTIQLAAKRGDILDRQNRVLAYSVEADSIYAVPTEISQPERTVAELCRVLGCDAEQRSNLAERITRVPGKRRHFAWVRRQVSPDDARRVAALRLDGIGSVKEGRRFYPNTTLAAHLLGWVGLDNTGLGGIEAKYNDVIRGRTGTALVQVDARHRPYNRVERPPTAGASVQLTIDQGLQWVVEGALREGVAQHRAKGGMALAMDPWTGEILAMANEPTFNPNAASRFKDELRTNRAIQYIYEPGSTFKSVTAAAAIEERVMRVSDQLNVAPGYINIGSRRVNDTHRYGVLSFEDVIVKSSNVGAIKVGFMLGPERLNRYVRRFGFGQRLSRDFDGESPGIVWSQLSDGALASVSMGYQIGVTPLQMVTAVSSIANGGRLMEPRLVKAIVGPSGRVATEPREIRRTVTPETAAVLTTIMEGVVDRGTGRAARLEGYTVAGKTGTAAKLVNNVYSKSEYMSSFVGFFPSRRPAVTIIVVIDAPQTGVYYGGAVAAPIFHRIAEAASRHLALTPSIDPNPPVLIPVRRNESPVLVKGPATSPDVVRTVVRPDQMPDLRGLSAREALRTLARLGIHARMDGVGVVADQQPAAGTVLENVVECSLWLAREAPPPPATDPIGPPTQGGDASRDDR